MSTQTHPVIRMRMLCLCVLAFQTLLQMSTADNAFTLPHHTEMHDFVNSLRNPNNPTPRELEKIHQLVESSNMDIQRSFRQEIGLPSGVPAPSLCEKKSEKSIFVFGKCPDVCAPFSLDAFVKCGSLIQFGCALKPCGLGVFTCTLREDLRDTVTVCPGDKVVFEDVELRTLQKVSFQIDLRAPPLRTDLYLLSDATGSMGRAINAVKTKFLDLIKVFGARKNVGFGVGFYRDETELTNGFQNSQAITEDQNAVRTAVNNLRATGGGDGDEANLVALYKVATEGSIGWRAGSRKILVYFGDWPGHEPTCAGRKKLTRSIVATALKAKDITVVAVSFPPPGIDAAPRRAWGSCHRDRPAGPGQADSIISATGGVLVSKDDQAKLVTAITEAVGTLSRRFDVDESECVDKIDSVHTPALPLTLAASEKTTVTNTISVKPSICEAFGSFECRYKYTESGADLSALNMEFVNIKGCPSA